MRAAISILMVALYIIKAEVPFSVTRLDGTGVIFEDVKETLLYKDTWNIFTGLNLSRISSWKDYVNWSKETIVKLCDQHIVLGLNKTCNQDIQNVQYISRKIYLAIEKLNINPVRQKRSIFDGVGKLSNFLFGTMDQDDAKEIYSRLDNLDKEGNQNLNLIKQQVSLIQSNYESNKQIYKKFSADLENIKNQTSKMFESINKGIGEIYKASKNLEVRLSLDELSANLILHLQEIEHQIENLYIILNSLSNKQLHPLILSYSQIAKLLQNLPLNYPLNEILYNPFTLQQIGTVDSSFIQETIICKITIPLLQKEWFTLKKVYPLPMHSNSSMSVHYKLSEDYLITDKGGSKMIPLFVEQLKSCVSITTELTKSVLLCHLTLPIYTAPDNHCLLLLYRKWPEASHICNLSPILREHNTFIKMIARNSWIYILINEITIKIICKDFQTIIKLRDTGILTSNPGCEIETGTILLPSTNMVSQNVSVEQVEILPRINLSIMINQIPERKLEHLNNTLHFIDHERHTDYFRGQQIQLDELIKSIDKAEKERLLHSYSQHNFAYTSCLAVLAFLLVIVIIIIAITKLRKIKRRISSRSQNPNKSFSQKNESRQVTTKAEHIKIQSIPRVVVREEPPTTSAPNLEGKSTRTNVSDFEIV